MKQISAWLLFAVMFLTSFDMHAQMPLLSPFAKEIGASSVMIGVILGAYSMSNLIGNLMAGPFLDRFSKKRFIGGGLFLSGLVLIGHGMIDQTNELFGLRLLYGYAMAFVTPACYALLGQLGRTGEEQGRIMAKNGILLTAGSIVSPAVGGYLAVTWGLANSFIILGGVMMATGLLALLVLPHESDKRGLSTRKAKSSSGGGLVEYARILHNRSLYPAYITALALMFANGTLMYEIPLLIMEQKLDPSVTGYLFSVMGAGSLVVLIQFWLNRTSPWIRCIVGLFQLALLFYVVAIDLPISLYVTMFFVGACFGLLFPAMSTLLTQAAPQGAYGTAFSLFSAVLSLGVIVSPVLAGVIDNLHRSFFISFCVLMVSGMVCLFLSGRKSTGAEPVVR